MYVTQEEVVRVPCSSCPSRCFYGHVIWLYPLCLRTLQSMFRQCFCPVLHPDKVYHVVSPQAWSGSRLYLVPVSLVHNLIQLLVQTTQWMSSWLVVSAVPGSRTCDVRYNTGTTSPWTLTANCSVTGAYSFLDRYSCQLVQVGHTGLRSTNCVNGETGFDTWVLSDLKYHDASFSSYIMTRHSVLISCYIVIHILNGEKLALEVVFLFFLCSMTWSVRCSCSRTLSNARVAVPWRFSYVQIVTWPWPRHSADARFILFLCFSLSL